MINFKISFDSRKFEKSMVEQFEKEIRKKLSRAGIRGVTVKIDPRTSKIRLSGPDDAVKKASEFLEKK